MNNTGGLNIMTDDSFDGGGLIPMGDGAQELDLSSGSGAGEIIDPKDIAAQAAAASADNHKLLEEEEEEKEEEPNQPLDIIDDTKKDDEEEVEEEVEEEEETPEDTPAASTEEEEEGDEYETFKVLGKHFSDEGILVGFDDEMENTPEALQEMVSKTVEKGIEEYKDSFKHPMAKQFLEYLENGGDPGRFINVVSGPDYGAIESDQVEGNTAIQKQLLRDQMTANGDSPEDIEETIQAFEDAGQLEKRSLTALKKLQKSQEAKKVAELEKQKELKAQQVKKNEQILTELKDKIDGAEEIGGFTLTKKIRKDFYDYITKVDPKTGKTGLLTDSSDPDNQLLMSYLYFNKFNFGKLEKKTKTKQNKSLEAKLGRYTDSAAKNKARKKTKVQKQNPGQLNLGPMKKLFG